MSADFDSQIDRLARARRDELIRLRHRVHQHPELSNRESETSALVADHLRSIGLDEVRTGIAGHGVVGVLRGLLPGERVAALRADMDALPVAESTGVEFASTTVDDSYPGGPFPVAHACGHDCHTAVVLATASVLADMRDRLPGTVLFIFQPAEEGPPLDETGGARAMLAAGALADPEPTMVFGMHVGPLPAGVVGYRAGISYAASCVVRVTVTGRQVHGSTPWMGIDPMPAAAGIIGGVGELYRQVPAQHATSVSIGHVQDVGRFNIIGQTVTLFGTIRCTIDADMAAVQQGMRRLAMHQAEAFGCTADVEFLQSVPGVINQREWIDAILPALGRIVGRERIVEVPVTLGYDDVSEFVNAYGGAYLSYGVQDTRIDGDQLRPVEGGRGLFPNHSPGFYADDDCLVDAVRVHAGLAVGHLAGEITAR
ncbi:M20 metallopeptidase family protein [Arthrobacter sp. H-02-3]|uniref:M20 metallopeptidase family protein n=1 Tax=Arthrobacter sp. H-02-3 TaxID=2703675 RepID=UPI000DD230D7|nr:amidohydrolase [Arthrobacter sp. H-02-3]PVZ60198.1 amidohydrolase [Arthrobacter sp. H-02-3]